LSETAFSVKLGVLKEGGSECGRFCCLSVS
jgi:hypothetical protein